MAVVSFQSCSILNVLINFPLNTQIVRHKGTKNQHNSLKKKIKKEKKELSMYYVEKNIRKLSLTSEEMSFRNFVLHVH